MLTVTGPNFDDLMKRLPSEKLARLVMWRALQRGVTAGRVAAAREASRRYTVRQGQVNRTARISKPSQSNLEGAIQFKGGASNIADFKVAPSKPQPARRPVLRVTVSRDHGQRPYRGAFLIPVRAGTYKAFRRDGKDRLPISPVYGPSIPTLVGGERVREVVRDRMAEVVLTRLDHEVNRELMKGG